MSTHVAGFQSFFLGFLHHFVLAKLATSNIRVKIFRLSEQASVSSPVTASVVSSASSPELSRSGPQQEALNICKEAVKIIL